MAEFDPTVIEYHAAYLYRRAAALTRGSTALGALVGAAAGAYPLTRYSHWPIPHSYGIATLLVGMLAGGLIGFVVGDSRANAVRVQAQLVLHQLQLERNTAAIVEALLRQAERAIPPMPFVTASPLVEVPHELEGLELEAPPLSA
jgi:hypothetical protein